MGITPESLAQSQSVDGSRGVGSCRRSYEPGLTVAQEEFVPDDRQFHQQRRGKGAGPEARPLERGLDREPVGLGVLPSVRGSH